ncbi:MAG: right-handed parallel beta-helix repeat-containing protein, partial [Bacteroidota bacterium]
FNSVNVTGTDPINGRALEVLGGTNYTIKNNIFANNGGGYAAYVTAPVSTFNLDYNDYYSTKRRIAYFQNTNYDTLLVFAAATGKDANSKSVNPFYTTNTNLQANHTLLNETGTVVASVDTDIDNTLRSATPDIGAKEFSLCADDAGVNEFWGLSNPLPVGNNDIQVVLQNQGTNMITSATIYWQVNGVSQTPIVWNGYLPYKEDTIITIGTYNFPAGKSFQLKAWTADPSTVADCNTYNDTINVFDLATPLCGVYTIGGVSPDFPTFYDASVALNNAGVACPVIFKVRNGTYNEQIKLYDIPGSSALNPVMFESESGDSSQAQLYYQVSNPSNDFTLSMLGTGYVSFRKLGVRRNNGSVSVSIQNRAHNIGFENCRIGNFLTPNAGLDSVLTVRNNNFQGFHIDLRHSPGNISSSIIIENNYVDNMYMDYCRNVFIKGNRNNSSPTSFLNELNVWRSSNLTIQNNRFNRLYCQYDTLVNIFANVGGPEYYTWNIYTSSCRKVVINDNIINARRYGIASDYGDSTYIRKNIITGTSTFENDGFGIYVLDIAGEVLVDSNQIANYLQYGIYSRSISGSNWTIRKNTIHNVRDWGIGLDGNGGKYTENKITGIAAGAGIRVSAANTLVANNYIQSQGLGVSKGISLQTGGTGSTIVFNSVNVTGTDPINGRALEVLGGTNYTIKNNIFANNGG